MKRHNICIIPARGGSKGIPMKNIRSIAGKPLLAWTIEAAKKSNWVDDIIVSTDNKDIADIAKQYGANIHWRSEKNSSDNIHAIHAILECIEYCEKENITIQNVIMLLATSPLRVSVDIDSAISIFENGNCDSVVSVVKFDKPATSLRKVGESGFMAPIVNADFFEIQRQDVKEQLYEVNGSIFVSSCENLKQRKSFHTGKVRPYIMPKCRSIDINSMDDWSMAEIILEEKCL